MATGSPPRRSAQGSALGPLRGRHTAGRPGAEYGVLGHVEDGEEGTCSDFLVEVRLVDVEVAR